MLRRGGRKFRLETRRRGGAIDAKRFNVHHGSTAPSRVSPESSDVAEKNNPGSRTA
jgi:hypothetical protein